MALGKMAQSSCCWNCALQASLVHELILSPCFDHNSSCACWLLHPKPYTAFENFHSQSQWELSSWHCWACATWRISLKFENYDQMGSSPLVTFLCSQTELRITKSSTKLVDTGCPHWLFSQHNLTKASQWKILHLPVLTCTKIPATNHFSSSCQFISVNHLGCSSPSAVVQSVFITKKKKKFEPLHKFG